MSKLITDLAREELQTEEMAVYKHENELYKAREELVAERERSGEDTYQLKEEKELLDKQLGESCQAKERIEKKKELLELSKRNQDELLRLNCTSRTDRNASIHPPTPEQLRCLQDSDSKNVDSSGCSIYSGNSYTDELRILSERIARSATSFDVEPPLALQDSIYHWLSHIIGPADEDEGE